MSDFVSACLILITGRIPVLSRVFLCAGCFHLMLVWKLLTPVWTSMYIWSVTALWICRLILGCRWLISWSRLSVTRFLWVVITIGISYWIFLLKVIINGWTTCWNIRMVIVWFLHPFHGKIRWLPVKDVLTEWSLWFVSKQEKQPDGSGMRWRGQIASLTK